MSEEADYSAEDHAKEFWDRQARELAEGEFWADRIKKVRDNPEERLRIALENMPLPAAFREAKIALRTIIRKKRKEKSEFGDELRQLYRIAAWESFLQTTGYCRDLRVPEINVASRVPMKVLDDLRFDYRYLGYEKLPLSKTDVKWVIEAWGKPQAHRTLRDLYGDLWKKYVQELKIEYELEEEKSRAEWAAMGIDIDAIGAEGEKETRIPGGRSWRRIVGLIIIAAILYLLFR